MTCRVRTYNPAESVFVVVVDVGAIFSIFRKLCKKSFFQRNKLSGDIGPMVQMLNLNFVAAAVSNY